MKRAALQALWLVVGSSLAGVLVNAVHPRGVPLFRPLPTRASTDPNFVTLETARELHRRGHVAFIDARPAGIFAQGHIEGSWSLPYDDFERASLLVIKFVERGYDVLVYCDTDRCAIAEQVAVGLRSLGYTKVRVFESGWDAWKRAGGPTEP